MIPTLDMGGAENMAVNLALALKAKGNEIAVCTYNESFTPLAQKLRAEGIVMKDLQKKPGIDFKCLKNMRRILKEFKPDVIHTHTHVLMYAYLAAGSIPVVHTLHSIASKEQSSRLGKLIGGFLYKYSRKVTPVAISEVVEESLREEFGVTRKVPLIYNGVPVAKMLVKGDYEKKEGDSLKIYHVGRLMHLKNHAMMIECMEDLSKQYPALELHFFGDGEDREKLEQMVREKQLSSRIFFEGIRTDLWKQLKEGDIFILPSQYEGMPLSLVEAMAAGLPVIATSVGGAKDVMEADISGLLCDPTKESLRQQLIRLVEDAALREKLGKAAMERAKLFSDETMAENYLTLYRKVQKH